MISVPFRMETTKAGMVVWWNALEIKDPEDPVMLDKQFEIQNREFKIWETAKAGEVARGRLGGADSVLKCRTKSTMYGTN